MNVFNDLTTFRKEKKFLNKEAFIKSLNTKDDVAAQCVSLVNQNIYQESNWIKDKIYKLLYTHTDFRFLSIVEQKLAYKELMDFITNNLQRKNNQFNLVVFDFNTGDIVHQVRSKILQYDSQSLLCLGDIYYLGYTSRIKYELKKIKGRLIYKSAIKKFRVSGNWVRPEIH